MLPRAHFLLEFTLLSSTSHLPSISVAVPPFLPSLDPPTHTNSRQNFIVNAAQAQLNSQLIANDGSFSSLGRMLDRLDVAFTCVFTVELLINAFAHWFTPFVSNQYNLIDCLVIGLSLVSLGPLEIPVSILRVVRAFRVIRIFGRLSALKNIINALTASLIPVFNSFLLILVFMSICASPPPINPGPSLFQSRTSIRFGHHPARDGNVRPRTGWVVGGIKLKEGRVPSPPPPAHGASHLPSPTLPHPVPPPPPRSHKDEAPPPRAPQTRSSG